MCKKKKDEENKKQGGKRRTDTHHVPRGDWAVHVKVLGLFGRKHEIGTIRACVAGKAVATTTLGTGSNHSWPSHLRLPYFGADS
jgi:hypothetical protein